MNKPVVLPTLAPKEYIILSFIVPVDTLPTLKHHTKLIKKATKLTPKKNV